MYIKKIYGYIECHGSNISKGALDFFIPTTHRSRHYKNWVTYITSQTCAECLENNGKIYRNNEMPDEKPPLHPNCHCEIMTMEAVLAGSATKDGENGADWWLKNNGILPDYYISSDELEKYGWQYGDKPSKFALGKMYTEGVYKNRNGHLPQKKHRGRFYVLRYFRTIPTLIPVSLLVCRIDKLLLLNILIISALVSVFNI